MSKRSVLAVDFGTVNTYYCKCPGDKVTPVGVDFGDNRDGLATAMLLRQGKKALIGDTALEEFGDATNAERKSYVLRYQFKPDIARSEQARESAVAFLKGVLEEAVQMNLELNPAHREVIFGVPSESDDDFRRAVTEIAKEAGYGTVRTLDEPKGALLNHISHKDIPAANALKGILVVDFGGGTCDFTFMYRGKVQYSWGDMSLGGRVFDDLFFQWFLEENPDAYAQMVENGDEFFIHWSVCREMKEKFSQTMTRDRTEMFRKAVREYGRLSGASWDGFVARCKAYTPSETFKRHLLDIGVNTGRLAECGSTIDLFDWFRSSLIQGIEKHGIAKNEIRFVIQAGGSSLWPFVTEIVIEELGIEQSQIMRSDRPYAAIAEGLAILPALQEQFKKTQSNLKAELKPFIEEKLNPLVLKHIDTVARDIAESLAAELYDQKLRGILLEFRKQGGSVTSLEKELASAASAFEPRVKELVQERMSLLSSGLASIIRDCVKEWFAEHELAPPERDVNVSGGHTDEVLSDIPDVSKGMFVDIAGLVTVITASIVAMICGGSGMALIASGPIGLIVGIVVGVGVAIAGVEAAKRIPIPALALKVMLTESKLNSAREKLKDAIALKITELSATFDAELQTQITDMVCREIDSLSEINQM